MYIRGRARKLEHDKDAHSHSDIDGRKFDHLKKAYQRLEEVYRELRESHMEMILRLAIAAEYRDPDTGSHIIRVSDYAAELGRMIQLPEKDVETLRAASPMHDIGKIAIPDRILLKKGKLTPKEYEEMKEHAAIGARMFENSKSPILRAASEIAFTHHEKYDGSGYPRGLKGDAIPIFGRIVAVVDVFDAIASKRPYKKERPFKETMEHIKTLAWNHLDPQLVFHFVKNQDRIHQIYTASKSIESFVAESEEAALNE